MDNFDLKKYLVENKVTTNSKMLKENTDPIYKYSFTLSRGLFYDGEEEVSQVEMMNFINKMWKEQGPEGSDIMQIYAYKNIETKNPVVVVELDDAVILYSSVRLSEEVATTTASKANEGTTIQPVEVSSYL